MNNEYKSGYGQAKADAIAAIKEQIKIIDDSISSGFWDKHNPLTVEKKKELSNIRNALVWALSSIRSKLKPE